MHKSADVVAPVRQVVLFSIVSAVFSMVGVAVASHDHVVPWTAILAGVIVACAGFQIANARRVLALSAPEELRTWMNPGSRVCYATAAILFLFGAWALLHRALAI